MVDTEADAESGTPELSAWERRRRRAAVFGDAMPDTTSDERGQGDERGGRSSDQWLLDQVPPHHGS
ncbi:MAG: hypothetical protein CMH83_07455 [Nocardioides sp.]|nr:hypothetical protein [Nocardioides sp.]